MGEPGVTDRGWVLDNVIAAASSLLDPSALARVAVAEVRRLVPLAFDDPRVEDPEPVCHPGQGVIGEAFQRGEPIAVKDYRGELAHPPVWTDVGAHASAHDDAGGRRCPAPRGPAARSGHGHALETLKRVPARDLKLDRSFVEHVAQDATDSALVRAAVEVGHALGMEVVAEGIEDEVVLASVRELGCDLAQGYHLARPMDAAALKRWLPNCPQVNR